MSERRFVIMEIMDNEWLRNELADLHITGVTESELKRRLETIIRFFTNDPLFSFNETTWKATLGVLHGEGEKGEGMRKGTDMIAAERERQITDEG